MRRANFIFTVCLVLFLILLHGMEIPLRQSALREYVKNENTNPVIVEGKVTKIQSRSAGGYSLEVRIKRAGGRTIFPAEKILVVHTGDCEKPWELFRSSLTLAADLQVPDGKRNPGGFDYNLYLKSRGIFYLCRTDSISISEDAKGFYERYSRWLVKQRFLFSDQLSDTAKGLVIGVLFGDTSQLEEEIYEDFRNNGTAHVLAVSGLHVGILYTIYRKIMGRKRSLLSLLCLTGLLMTYGILSMWATSVLRAGMMIILHAAAEYLDLRYDMTTGLSTVALILIAVNPYVIFGTGFQMSFLAIGSISFLVPVLSKKIPDGLAAGLAVNLGLLVYQMYQFNYVSLVALAVNLPVIYLTGILVPVSLTAFGLFSVIGTIPGIMELLLDSFSFLMIKLNEVSTLDGVGSFDAASPSLWLAAVFYFLLFFLVSEQNLIWRSRRQYGRLVLCASAGVIAAAVLAGLYYCPVSDDDVVFVDVGQGDCVHIRAGKKNILIDGGGSLDYNTGKNTVKPYLLKNGVGKIDLAVATHLHMDHYKGLEELAQVYPVKELRTGLTAGNNILITESIWIETLWPLEIDEAEGQEANENCSVFMIHYNGRKILITGDLDEAGELAMVEHYRLLGEEERLDADILKVGHHGSRTSTSDLFLDEVSPEYAVIQVGARNIYGHPNEIVIEKNRKRGIMIRRNDYNGAIGFSFPKGKIITHSVIEDFE